MNVSGPRRLAMGCGYDEKGIVTREFKADSVLRAAKEFSLKTEEADAIFENMETFVKNHWREEFINAGFTRTELGAFEPCFSRS